jgi:uncharacterized protein (TIGR02246 family)
VPKLATFTAAVVVALLLTAAPALGQEGNKQAEKDLLERANAFAAAFAKGDAKALAGFWTPEGEYTNETGLRLQGRKAIAKAFEGFFAEHKGLKLRIEVQSLKFVTPDVAIEDGVTGVMAPDGKPPTQSHYTIVHVKKDGEWHLASVREAPFVPPTNYQHFRGLEWLIGDWVDEKKGEVAHVNFSWGPNQNFIVATFATTIKDIPVASGTQWIAWDPVTKQFRSWTFDSSGGFGEGPGTRKGNKWVSKNKMTLATGKTTTSTNIVTRVDADTITWQGTDRTLNGEAQPDTEVVTMKRAK